MQLAIIAGGKGTRLGFSAIPKPMVPIASKPLLEHQILLAKRYGIHSIWILCGHLHQTIEEYFGNGKNWGIQLHYVVETQPLGTAGAIKQLENKIQERFMVFYGDTVMDLDLEALIQADKKHQGLGTLVVHPNDHPYDSDLTASDQEGKITAFLSKPHPKGLYYKNWVNAALYILDPQIFSFIPSDKSSDFGKDIFPAVVKSGKPLFAYATAEYIKDMGTPDRLQKVSSDWESGKVALLNRKNSRPAVFLDRDGVINQESGDLFTTEQMKLIPGSAEAIHKINSGCALCLVVTNQPVLAKGLCSWDNMELIHKKMETLLGEGRAYIDDLFLCPHHPQKGFPGEVPELKIPCTCRKPEPGLLLQAMQKYNIQLDASWIIGDRYADIAAGKKAGVKTLLVHTGHAGDDKANYPDTVQPDAEAANLLEAVEFLLRTEKAFRPQNF